MPYRGFYDNDDEGKMSDFNAAALKMKRLDKILDNLNEINGNLFAWNEEYGVVNYELKFSRCKQLYQEVESKLTEKERLKGVALQEHLQKFIDDHPVYTKPKKRNVREDKSVKKILKKWLDKYETLVREYIDNHGMDTRYEDESGL